MQEDVRLRSCGWVEEAVEGVFGGVGVGVFGVCVGVLGEKDVW